MYEKINYEAAWNSLRCHICKMCDHFYTQKQKPYHGQITVLSEAIYRSLKIKIDEIERENKEPWES